MGINVALFGAYDINSFGDLLFPEAIEIELSKRIPIRKVILFSPTTNCSDYKRNKEIYSYDEFEKVYKQYSFQAIIIGGGELLNESDIEFKDPNGNVFYYKNGEIWKRPILLGKKYNIKVLVNSVGMSGLLSEEGKNLLSEVDYLSFRDRFSSKRYWGHTNETNQNIVPDSLWNLDDYYTVIKNKKLQEKVYEISGIDENTEYVALQIGTWDNFDNIFECVLDYCRNTNLQLIVFAINWCHDDKSVTNEIAKRYDNEALIINRLLQPEEIMAIISSSKVFIGTSFHGALVGCLAGVKVISYNMYSSFVSKMDGLVAWTNTELVENVNQLKQALLTKKAGLTQVEQIKSKLNRHFDNMAKVIESDSSKQLRNSEVVDTSKCIYDRSYIESIVENEVKYWKVIISEKLQDEFVVKEVITPGEGEIIWSFPLRDFYNIKLEGKNIEALNVDKAGNCFDRVARYKIKNNLGLLEIRYAKELQKKTEEFYNLLHLYWNKEAHVKQLEKSEREYMRTINEQNQMIRQNELLEYKIKNVEEKLVNIEEFVKVTNENRINELIHEKETLTNKCTELYSRVLELDKKLVEKEAEIVYIKQEYEVNNSRLNQEKEELLLLKQSISKENIELKQQNENMVKENAVLEDKSKVLKEELAELMNKQNNLVQTVRNKEGHIEQLLEAEREYEREKKSRTYRLALKFRKFSLAILPVNSKRRFFVHLLGKAIKHPILMLKMINPRRIKNCMTILKTEGVSSAMNHLQLVEEYEKSRGIPVNNENIVIEQVTEEEKRIEDYEKLVFPVVNNPDVSIIIPVYNQFDYTYHCLESILKNSGTCKYEVIIANDCSTDLTSRIDEIVSGIHVITNKENLRFLLNCNNAAKKAKGKYILFLNNDTQVQADWLQPLITLIESDQTIGMVGSKLVYADGYLQEAGGILWKDASAWNYGNRQNPNDSEFNYVREVDYISGAAIMIRTSLWKKIGGFDVRFVPAYCEDSDLAFEVRRHGYKVVYQPKSVVVHFEGISNGTDLSSGQKKYQVDNQVKFVEKWREELEKNHFENGTNVFLARERSKDKKHVLVIDHYVPQYDKDAGSKTTWMYLKMLVKKGYKVTFLGDNFYQHEPYTTELQQMGIFVLYGPKYAEGWKEWLSENIQYFDIFYLNRPHISIKYIDFIKERARGKIIYYGHDLHFLRIQREYEISKEAKLLEESKKWLEQETYLMKKADMSYYPSVIEENAIHEIDATIPVKAITAYVFEQFEKIAYNLKDRQGLLFVGGFGHGPNLDAVLWFLDKVYPEVYKRTKAPFYIVGSKAPEEITNIKTEGVVVKGFVSEEELQMLYKQCRIAVVPLRYGAGVKGKVVEALYYGIPIVTTSVGAEGINGIEEFSIVKDNEKEIIEEICTIYNDEKILKNMSDKNQEYVKKHFSVDAVWNIIREEFE